MAIDEMAKQASAGGESEVKFLTPLDINTKSEKRNIVDSKNTELSTLITKTLISYYNSLTSKVKSYQEDTLELL